MKKKNAVSCIPESYIYVFLQAQVWQANKVLEFGPKKAGGGREGGMV
jgi:hypothetical protein